MSEDSVEFKKKSAQENNGFVPDHDYDDDVEAKVGGSRKNSQTEEAQVYAVQINETPLDVLTLKPYAGMPKEVLLQFSRRPGYRITREIIFWLIVVATVVIVAATIAIIALSPRCLDWWQSSPIYQVYPKSFRDSDSDGSGDLKGIQEKVDHFSYLDVKNVWIAPFYKASLKDYHYAVDDFRAVDPSFGTMADFDNMLAALHDKGLKLIIDLIPNHTSNKHEWFELSRSRTGKYTDYYIWHDCELTGDQWTPPNNWVSVYGSTAWEYDATRQQCYFHQFRKEQPDLNLYNPDVIEEIQDIIKFWLEKGVDGLTIDAAKFILEAKHLRDEPLVSPLVTANDGLNYTDLFHDFTTTQVGMHDIIRSFRQTMNDYSREPGRYRFMGTESDDGDNVQKTMIYYGNDFIKEADFPLNFHLLNLNKDISATAIFDFVNLWMASMPEGKWPQWTVGSPSNSRVASRVGKEYVDVLNMLLLTLPGTPTLYYGEELGMVDGSDVENSNFSLEYNPNEFSVKTPMLWDASQNAGFSEANSTWLPVNPGYQELNVAVQKSKQDSSLNLYRAINRLRKNELPIHRGWLCYTWTDENVFAYVREMDGLNKVFMMVLNFGRGTTINMQQKFPELPTEAKITLSTLSSNTGKTVNMNSIQTQQGEGIILEYRTSKQVHFMDSFKDQCFISEKACYSSFLNLLYKNC
uniref:Amino acid transporter heavy chain SLC3A1 n=1 Tax=Leptobrachium leishanense TaxID=445787 RepID=A0A8C5MHG8_9ANUR